MMRVVSRGWRDALVLGIVAIPLLVIVPPIGVGALLCSLGILIFFRDPTRSAPVSGIVSPADGRVSVIRDSDDGFQVGIYMGVTDVHVNRAPVAGQVIKQTHRKGAHRPAFSKDSNRNERVRFYLKTESENVYVDLIAGAFARRITPYVDQGDSVEKGERMGHIAFGSRADITLPEGLHDREVCVTIGQRVRAGETIIIRDQKTDTNASVDGSHETT